jgi:hypothetical protein
LTWLTRWEPCQHRRGRDARDIKVHRAIEHVDLYIRQQVGQVLLHDMGGAVVAAGKFAIF